MVVYDGRSCRFKGSAFSLDDWLSSLPSFGMCKHPKPFSLSSSSSGNGVKQEFGLLLRLKILHKSLGLTVTCSALRTYDNT